MVLILAFESFLWCLVRTVKVFVINSEYHVIVIGAMLTLETEINVLVISAQYRLDCMFQDMMCGGDCT